MIVLEKVLLWIEKLGLHHTLHIQYIKKIKQSTQGILFLFTSCTMLNFSYIHSI